MVRVIYDCSNCIDSITDCYDIHAYVINLTEDYVTTLHNFADYISMSFGTHHAGNGYTTYLEYIEFQDYGDFKIALSYIKDCKYEEALAKVSRFATGIINITE